MTSAIASSNEERTGQPALVNADGSSSIVLLCEHASNFIPRSWNNLGLSDEQLQTHHAWDAGADDMTLALSQLLDAPAILSGVSRLFLDYNRPARHPRQFPEKIDSIRVSGNCNLDDQEISEREKIAYFPFSCLVEQVLDKKCKSEKTPILVSVHTCEPEWEGHHRPWPVAIISEWDRRLAAPLVAQLKSIQEQPVGDNQPYDGRSDPGHTLARHATSRRIPNAALEMRKDVLQHAEGLNYWSGIVADSLSACVKTIQLRRNQCC
jgi:predicted N-formylglutamate amidohydrolase